ncbi:MAG TPA: Trk system potassium transporter TrkA [bacterium]|nr:Trk system potassium transporter TrkA [bacterium]HOL46787.1 Trk system potassium transporter TrkA [bacterium]HPQ17742.1 Trk system potassium transporter TrkA [bacterium]
MKIVIVGAGAIGEYIAETLSYQENEIIIIDTNINRLNEISEKYEVQTATGNALNFNFLKSLNISDADLFIAVTNDDAVNVISALTAKNLGVKKTITRIRNKEFLEGRTERDFFGIDLVICPENASAYEIVKRLITPGTEAIESFAFNKIFVREFNISKDCKIRNTPIKHLNLGNILIIGIYRNERIIIPTGNDHIEEGDKIYVIGSKEEIFAIDESFASEDIVRKKIMIFGGKNIGFTLAKMLENYDFEIKLIEPDINQCEFLTKELDKTIVLNATALDPDFLEQENIHQVDTFIGISNYDEDNLISAVLAKSKGVKEALITIVRNEYMNIAKKLGIDTIVNPLLITASAILSFLMKDKMKTIAILPDEKTKLIELKVTEKCDIINQPLIKAKLPSSTLIGAILRDERVIIPKGIDTLKIDDIAIIVTLEKNISEILKIFY